MFFNFSLQASPGLANILRAGATRASEFVKTELWRFLEVKSFTLRKTLVVVVFRRVTNLTFLLDAEVYFYVAM